MCLGPVDIRNPLVLESEMSVSPHVGVGKIARSSATQRVLLTDEPSPLSFLLEHDSGFGHIQAVHLKEKERKKQVDVMTHVWKPDYHKKRF